MTGGKRCRVALLATLAAAVVAAVPALAGELSLEEVFANPPQQAKPRVRWWWPGADVTAEELQREIALLDEAGFGGAEIQALSPNISPPPDAEATARINDYAEPRFFDMVKAAGAAAATRGMDLDYTFGSSWPSGGGFAIPPEKALVELTMAYTAIKGGSTGPITVEIPKRTGRLGALGAFDPRVRDPAAADWKDRFDGRAATIRVLAMRGTAPEFADANRAGPLAVPIKLSAWSDVAQPGVLDTSEVIDLTDRLGADGLLDWSAPEGDWLVFVLRKYASNMGVLGAAGQGPQLVLDHFDHSAFAAHAARVGDPLGKNPAGLRATFVDSLELMQDLPWSEDFLVRFRDLRGYDLAPYLPLLVQPGWMAAWQEHYSPPYFEAKVPDLAERVREDYRQTISDLIFAEFLDPWRAWNKAHGLETKFQAHGGAIDQIRAYGLADIPETEDLVDNGDPLFMRLARSAANLYGHKIVSAESLVWKDRPFDVTPDEMRSRLDMLYAGGVNSVNLHGLPYRYAADAWPGWHTFAPTPVSLGFSTMLAESNPIWPAVPQLAAYAARAQALLQAGDPVVPVAFFYGDIGYYVGIETEGQHERPIEAGLIADGYDYDRINPDAIDHAKVVGGELLSAGGHRYAALVLPPIDALPVATAERLAEFAQAGLPIFFVDKLPDRSTGLHDAAENDRRTVDAIASMQSAGGKVVSITGLGAALQSANIPANLTFSGDATDILFVQRRAGDRLITFLHNGGASDVTPAVTLPGMGGVTQWDAMDGAIRPLDAERVEGGTLVRPLIPAGQGVLLVQDSGVQPQRIADLSFVSDAVVSPVGWSLSASGHVAREPFSAKLTSVSLGDWRDIPELARFAGVGIYSATFDLPGTMLADGRRVALSLGDVADMAMVRVNGVAFPPLISRPWRLDITGAVHAGANAIEVEIRNVPQNAMIGEKGGYRKLQPVPAGLIGPVEIYSYETGE